MKKILEWLKMIFINLGRTLQGCKRFKTIIVMVGTLPIVKTISIIMEIPIGSVAELLGACAILWGAGQLQPIRESAKLDREAKDREAKRTLYESLVTNLPKIFSTDQTQFDVFIKEVMQENYPKLFYMRQMIR